MMNKQGYFQPQQAVEVAEAFSKNNVEYMFIGKSGAILLGYPASTQDVELFPKKSVENGENIIKALNELGFELNAEIEKDILKGKNFMQMKTGPFDLDLVFAPDGISSFEDAKERMHKIDNFPIAYIGDIIASKRASGRKKDLNDLPLLEKFKEVFEKNIRKEPRTALEIALEKLDKKEE